MFGDERPDLSQKKPPAFITAPNARQRRRLLEAPPAASSPASEVDLAETIETLVPVRQSIPNTPHMAALRRILVVGLGNPGNEYRDTFHSVGNLVLEHLQRKFPTELSPFESHRHGKKGVMTSIGSKYTLMQSPTFMNVTGPWLSKAYKEFLVGNKLTPAELGLVVVHDELEEELGVVKILPWDRSPRGHNGVKSVHKSLSERFDKEISPWARVVVGIGRPISREPEEVASFVLGKLSRHNKAVMEEVGSIRLHQALAELESKWGWSALGCPSKCHHP